MTDTLTKEPTAEQVQRLCEFALEYGPGWKDKLADMWLTGRDDLQRDGHLLRQVRNQLGPSWLKDWTLPPQGPANPPAPLHVVTIDGTTFHLRRDFHARYAFHEVKPEGTEQSVGRMNGYASAKEAFDSLFQRALQD